VSGKAVKQVPKSRSGALKRQELPSYPLYRSSGAAVVPSPSPTGVVV